MWDHLFGGYASSISVILGCGNEANYIYGRSNILTKGIEMGYDGMSGHQS